MAIYRTERPGVGIAPSASTPGRWYVITGLGTPFLTCSCPVGAADRDCKHQTEALEMTAEDPPQAPGEESRALAIAQRSGQVTRATAARLAAAEALGQWQTVLELGRGLAASGLMPPGLDTPEKVAVVMLKALSLGIDPIQAPEYIDVIKGRPYVRAQMIRALVEASGRGRIEVVEASPERAVCIGVRPGRRPLKVTYTMEDAVRAGLVREGPEPPPRGTRDDGDVKGGGFGWKYHPADMLVARASSRIGRRMFADVLAGMGLAVEGEAFDTPEEPEEGGAYEVIDGEAVEVPEDEAARPEGGLSIGEAAELDAHRREAGIAWGPIADVLGGTVSQAHIRAWLDAAPDRTPASLVRAAADKLAARGQ